MIMALQNLPLSEYHVVYIWMSIGAQQFGHASLLLSNGVYISWWPKGKKIKVGLLSKVGSCSVDLQEDINKEHFEPEYKFYIPSCKLHINRMTQYWNGWQKRGHYALLNRNCCSMVYRVLQKGGAPRSATIVWRPETLRRYVVIYLGGGSKNLLFWNLPGSDEQYKENHSVYIWTKSVYHNGHASVEFEDEVYISWWPLSQTELRDDKVSGWVDIQDSHASSGKGEDIERIGHAEDIRLRFRPMNLDLSAMTRRWKKFTGEEQKIRWRANCFWLIYQILKEGGAPSCNNDYDYWNEDSLQKYICSNFSLVME